MILKHTLLILLINVIAISAQSYFPLQKDNVWSFRDFDSQAATNILVSIGDSSVVKGNVFYNCTFPLRLFEFQKFGYDSVNNQLLAIYEDSIYPIIDFDTSSQDTFTFPVKDWDEPDNIMSGNIIKKQFHDTIAFYSPFFDVLSDTFYNVVEILLDPLNGSQDCQVTLYFAEGIGLCKWMNGMGPGNYYLTGAIINKQSLNDYHTIVTPYSNGEITINLNSDDWENSLPGCKSSSRHTFSNGLSLTVVEVNQGVTGGYYATGGLVFLHHLSQCFYKKTETINNIPSEGHYWGDYSLTMNSDVNWNQATSFPDDSQLLNIDSIYYSDKPDFYKGRPIYEVRKPIGDWDTYYDTLIPFTNDQLIYVKSYINTYMKLQVSKVALQDEIRIRWAADSLGNKMFRHDPVGIVSDFNKAPTPTIKQTSIEKVVGNSFTIPSKKVKSIEVYSLNGKLLAKKNVTDIMKVDLSDMQMSEGMKIIRFKY